MSLTPPRLISAIALSTLASLPALGCQRSQGVCTAMGCSDQATITAKLSPPQAALGTHTFALEVDGVAHL